MTPKIIREALIDMAIVSSGDHDGFTGCKRISKRSAIITYIIVSIKSNIVVIVQTACATIRITNYTCKIPVISGTIQPSGTVYHITICSILRIQPKGDAIFHSSRTLRLHALAVTKFGDGLITGSGS